MPQTSVRTSPATTTAAEPPPPAERPTGRRPARRWFWPGALLAGYAAEVLFRLHLVRQLSYPSIHPDEESYLVLARVLAGHQITEMPVGVVIPGGYPLLVSPALRIADDPVTAYHLVLGTNALLNALILPIAWLGLRRLGLDRPQAYAFAAATALLPPLIFYSEFAMTDTVMPVLILAWLLCMHGWLSDGSLRRRAWYAAGTGATAAYAMATHDRGGVVVAVTAVVFVGVLLLRWAPWRTVVAGLGALGTGLAGGKLLNAWLHAQFTVPASDVGGFLWKGLTDPEATRRTLTRTVGQIWYFIISTWGIGGLAVAVCLFAVFSKRFPRPHRITGGVMVALLAGTALAAAAALPDDKRIDDWVYARYASYLVPAAFTVGAAVLCRFRRRTLGGALAGAAGLTLVLGEAVIRSAGSLLRTQLFIPWGMPDALFLADDWGALRIMRTTAAAFAVLGVVVLLRLLARRRAVWAGVALALFAGYATVTITEQISYPHSNWRKGTATGFTRSAGIRPDDSVVFSWDTDWALRGTQAFEVYRGRVWFRDPLTQPIPAAATVVVTAPAPEGKEPDSSWPERPAAWYVERIDRQQGWMIWRKH
ncbi:hypothetical protein F7Q99_08835 [Streptomyces kaniharaensis]|uniref:Phospholipid carrier-dependent glycosyltransferase n=1 Tax=Streptomyces kaniharaensis TaxID=212423 RepID=A0A6N7KPA4_9ACTN|nr:hypothetical protein [Streptomyces kaniharaensis]MQS12389.1 hypothetical protein [Streptomyces kaniharaensis]